MSPVSNKKRLSQARKERAEFSPRGSNCPICKKMFRGDSCPHSIKQVMDYLLDQILKEQVKKNLMENDNKTPSDKAQETPEENVEEYELAEGFAPVMVRRVPREGREEEYPGPSRKLLLPLVGNVEIRCEHCKKLRLKPHHQEPSILPPQSVCYFQACAQDVFSPRKIILTGDLEGLFVLDIKVGNISQLSSAGMIPAMVFASGDLDFGDLKMDTAQVSQQITITVQNQSTEPKACEASLLGVVARL